MFEECLYWLFQSNEFTLPHEDYTHFAVKCQLIGTLSEHSQQDFGSKSNLSESCWWICVQFCLWLQWPVTLTHLFFPLLFSCSLDSSCVSHIWDVWLFVLPKHPLGLACVPKPKGARNMLYKSVRTDRIFFFCFRREDHQRCQLQTHINYNLEDDPVRLTSVPLFVFVRVYFQVLFHISLQALKRVESQRLGDNHGNLKLRIEHKLPVAVWWEPFASEYIQYNLWGCGLCHWHFKGNIYFVSCTVLGYEGETRGARKARRLYTDRRHEGEHHNCGALI